MRMVEPFVSDPDFTLLNGDSLEVLRTLPDESVHCVVTSPPYWGLRDYGTGTWEGGDPDCDHKAPPTGGPNPERYTPGGGEMFRAANDKLYQKSCLKCDARRVDQQLGLEPTPDAYVANMVELFREVRRVLRRDGCCFLNMGDSYASDPKKGGSGTFNGRNGRGESYGRGSRDSGPQSRMGSGAVLKQKDLVGVPWRLAFALQAGFATCNACDLELRTDLWPIWNGHRVCIDCLRAGGHRDSKVIVTEPGWYLRSDIIWSKPNPMPESVTDRPTKAHEYLFLLTRSPRYFYDADAIRERYNDGPGLTGGAYAPPGQSPHGNARGPDGRRVTAVVGSDGSIQHRNGERWPNLAGRNARSVWEIATQPYPEAHFATFPEELARRCIAAGSPANGVVLDPFMGSGTVAHVARKLGRRSIGIELNPEYCALAAKRLAQQSLLAEDAA